MKELRSYREDEGKLNTEICAWKKKKSEINPSRRSVRLIRESWKNSWNPGSVQGKTEKFPHYNEKLGKYNLDHD